ncbi:MAG: 3-oxoadipate enol-lactonase [Steroidobacteraceae bacterium]
MQSGFLERAGAKLHYTVSGRNHAPALVLLHPLGASAAVFESQRAEFERSFRVIALDMAGHGASVLHQGAPRSRSLADLADDALAVLDALGIQRAHWCGVSIGGMIALHIAATAPQRVLRLVLANTAAYMGPRESWDERIAKVMREGIDSVAGGVAERWFTAEFRAAEPAIVERIVALVRSSDPRGYAEACGAVRDMDLRPALAAVQAPTLIIAGARDASTTPERAEELQSGIVGADLLVLDASHLACVEQAQDFNTAVIGFLRE